MATNDSQPYPRQARWVTRILIAAILCAGLGVALIIWRYPELEAPITGAVEVVNCLGMMATSIRNRP